MKKKLIIVSLAITVFLIGCSKQRKNITNDSVGIISTKKIDKRFISQNEIDKNLLTELKAGHTLNAPFYLVDPYTQSPLTAVVIFNTENETKISVQIEGKTADTTIKHEFDKFSKEHIIPIYGLYPNKNNKVTITALDSNNKSIKKDIFIKTEPLPDDISKVKVKVKNSAKMSKGLTFFDCPHVNGNYFLAIDSNGDIRWYLSDKSFNGAVMMAHMKNGNLIVGSGNVIPNSYNNLYNVFEISPLGKEIKEYDVYGIHHDIREKSNGNLIFAASKEGRDSQSDYIVEIDRKTGKQVNSWDLREIIPMTKYDTKPPYSGGLSNWLHNNAIWYLEDEDAFVISGRHQNMILKFDAKTKDIKWAFSGTVGEDNEQLRPYLLKPINKNFEYPMSQHAAMILPDGKLMLFDNRNDIKPNKDGSLNQKQLYSRAVIYEIDEKNKTIKEVWEFGKERGNKLYSSFVSDVDYLGKNHYLIDFGGMYTAKNGDSYDHIFTPKEIKNSSNRNSTVVEILNKQKIFEAVLYGNSNSNTYKAERKDIYQNAEEITLK